MTKFHRDRIESLRAEIDEHTEEYNRLDMKEQQLKKNHNHLISLRNDRRNVSDWTFEERQFVNEMSRK